MELKEIVDIRYSVFEQEKRIYTRTINQINSELNSLLDNNLGSKFLENCGRDIAGELVRTYFNTSDYNITVDQMYYRVKNFSYEKEYDPIGDNQDLTKLVYNYNESERSESLKEIVNDLEASKVKLFEKETIEKQNGHSQKVYKDSNMIKNGKEGYRNNRNSDGSMKDDYTGNAEEKKVNKRGDAVSQLDVEHTQALSTAYVYTAYLKEGAEERIKEFYNSADNFAMMDKTANQSKGDVKVRDKNGNDITHRATPEQLADAVAERWETCNNKELLMQKGYLDENGKINKQVKKELAKNYKNSQNKESKVILKETDYSKVGKKALKSASNGMGKIVAGQIIYYALPPLLFEIKEILKTPDITIKKALSKIDAIKDRLGNYVMSKLSVIFKGIMKNSVKNFMKTFFDILINTVKATVQKMLRLAKNLVLSVVDSVAILGNKNTTKAEKADAILNLMSITITSFVLEVLFEYLEHQFQIPEMFLLPIQTIATVVCTNFVTLILQEADLFDVRHGFLMKNISDLFDRENNAYIESMKALVTTSNSEIDMIIKENTNKINEFKAKLKNLNVYSESIGLELDKVNKIFDMKIDFEKEWIDFLGYSV
ncbi:hypothetical protein [Clostridium sp. 'White wine YQ']|uniref:hypothetical protein n=1 Tax=Clostridium sp. 'White wine YQ' TaxID=3027474 RepID=UPI002366304E|nr:hypothetical protein [Clostridium sp. 'White wine YQ']MDD7794365.1 hypothetical protein [Clostridium sp. 'White wine YQ']